MRSEKHRVRYYFFQNRYSHAAHNQFEGADVLSWEEREFETFGEALNFAQMVGAAWSKIMNEEGHVVYNSQQREARWHYA